jgi:hypothetical protein
VVRCYGPVEKGVGGRGECLSPSSPDCLPKCPGAEAGQRRFLAEVKEVLVTRDENVGSSGNGGGEDPFIVRVAQPDLGGLCRPRDDRLPAKEFLGLLNLLGRNAYLLPKNASEFDEVNFACQQLVFRQDEAKDVSGKSAGGQCADQNVGVEEDPHETSRKTSSSVRYPRASAKGMIWRRTFSNRRRAS